MRTLLTLCLPALGLALLGPAARAQAPAAEALTPAEERVQALVGRGDSVYVVHFWAPWCPNSLAELEAGWADLVRANPGVGFAFVTVWNNGKPGADVLRGHGLPERVLEIVQPDRGPSTNQALRRMAFLGRPMTWVPSTWIFTPKGRLAFALDYGEMDMPTLQHLIEMASHGWNR